MNALLSSVSFLVTDAIRKMNPFYEDKIVIVDEEGNICNYLLYEANHSFIGLVDQVKDLKKPIRVLIRNNVYIITLESQITDF